MLPGWSKWNTKQRIVPISNLLWLILQQPIKCRGWTRNSSGLIPIGHFSVLFTVKHECLSDREETRVPHVYQITWQELERGWELVTQLVDTVQEHEEQWTHSLVFTA